MSYPNPIRPPGRPLLHDPLTCGLGEKYCPGCAAEPPDATAPPWGESLIGEYSQILDRWANLDRQDRPGISREQRDRLAAEKLRTFDRAATVRARTVNEFLAILRWAKSDTPGPLSVLLREIVIEIIRPELADVISAVMVLEERINHRRVTA